MSTLEFFSRDGHLFYRVGADGPVQRFVLKGTNWFGLETHDFCLHGLWSVGMDGLLNFLAANKFNALRVPFSAELALNLDTKVPGNCNYAANPDMKGLKSAQMMDKLIDKCAQRGILVLLDLHHLKAANGIPELWYDDACGFPEAKVIEAWKIIATRYKDKWNVFAAELKNEPHGSACWGNDCDKTDWRLAAERIGKAVQQVNPKLLILVEGVESNVCGCPGDGSWWGGHLGGSATHPVRLPVADKLVYSPHTYGPSVHMQPYFSDPAFPHNLPAIWERHFGCVKDGKLGPAVVHTEWGGKADGIDEVWQRAFAAWLVQHEMADTFYWCLNPNSADTGGLLLDDWKSPHKFKLQLLDAMVPQPTLFDAQGNVKQAGTPPTLGPFLAPSLPKSMPCPPTATATVAAATAGVAKLNVNGTPPAAAQQPPPAQPKPTLPPPQDIKSGALVMKVKAEDAWLDGNGPVYKYICAVTNTGTAPLATVALQVSKYVELQQNWNSTLTAQSKPPAPPSATLGLPDWIAAGLAAGQSFEAGLVVKPVPNTLPVFAVSGK